jgi:hypothetical protein
MRTPQFGVCSQLMHASALPPSDESQDMSFLGNIPSAHDFFFRIPKPTKPYIAHTRVDGYTVMHAHPLNGTKFFTWGMAGFGTFQQDFMSASDYQNPKCNQDVYDPVTLSRRAAGRFALWYVSRMHYKDGH